MVFIADHQLIVAGQSNAVGVLEQVGFDRWPTSCRGQWGSAVGGTSLSEDWDPTTDPRGLVNKARGFQYPPSAAAGITILWWQGETDALAGSSTYYADFVELRAAVATVVFPVAPVLWAMVKLHIDSATEPGKTGIRAAQDALGADLPNVVVVTIDDLPGPGPSLHYPQSTYEIVLRRCLAHAADYFCDAWWLL